MGMDLKEHIVYERWAHGFLAHGAHRRQEVGCIS